MSGSLSKSSTLYGSQSTQPYFCLIDSELTRGFVLAAIGVTCVALGTVTIQANSYSLVQGQHPARQGFLLNSFESEVVKSVVFPQNRPIVQPVSEIESQQAIYSQTLATNPIIGTVSKPIKPKEVIVKRATQAKISRKKIILLKEESQRGSVIKGKEVQSEENRMRALYLSLREGFAYAVHFPERPHQFVSADLVQSAKKDGLPGGPPNSPKRGPSRRVPAAIVVGATLSTSRGDTRKKAQKDEVVEQGASSQTYNPSGSAPLELSVKSEQEIPLAPLTQSAMGASIDAIRLSAASATTEHDGRNLEHLNTQRIIQPKLSSEPREAGLLASQATIDDRSSSVGAGPTPTMSIHQALTVPTARGQVSANSDVSQAKQIEVVEERFASATIQPTCVEAFNWGIPVDDCQNEILTTRQSPSIQPWLMSTHSAALPTLQRKISGPAIFLSIQALSQIELLTGNRQARSRGIVFGKVPTDHIVSISGSSDPAIYFDSQNRLVSEHEADQPRYFVIFNVEKGAHRIQTTSLGTMSSAGKGNHVGVSVGIPVPLGGSVYVDLASTGVTTFQGMVIDGKEGLLVGQGRANVSILGFEHQTIGSTFTDIDGHFKFQQVPFAVGYPLDLQVLGFDSGITHRFQVDPISKEKQILPVFDADTISQWGDQLEGEPIQPNTGVIFGALPRLFLKALEEQTIKQGERLAVVVRPMFGAGKILSESYWLGDAGELLPGSQTRLTRPRFCSLNVDSGPQWVEIRTPMGKVVWSDLVFMSPDVVFPIGPN